MDGGEFGPYWWVVAFPGDGNPFFYATRLTQEEKSQVLKVSVPYR